MSKKISTCFVIALLLVTCTAYKVSTSYLVEDYINDLALISGIGDTNDINDNFLKLRRWGVVESEDIRRLKEPLNYYFLCETISKLIEEENDYLVVIKNMGWIDINIDGNSLVSKDDGRKIINSAVNYKNNARIESVYEYEYKDEIKSEEDDIEVGDIVYKDNEYKVVDKIEDKKVSYRDADIKDIYSYLNIADSFEVDFDDVEIIPYEQVEITNYANPNFNLLAAGKNHVFYTDGFRISYSFSGNGISVHVSKDINKVNVYCDLNINSIKPSYKFNFEEDDIKNSYFKVDFKTTEALGASIGKYGRYILDFKDVDSSSFKNLLESIVKKNDDEVEATLKICQIKTPIPNIPTAYFNIDVVIKLYVSGKIELLCYGDHEIGFESKDGNIRTICNNNHDIDAIIGASGRAALGLNFNLEAATFRLMDLELDGGVASQVKTTLHLYDEDGNDKSADTDLAYATVDEISKENKDVKVCGDLSLNWLFDVYLNTPSSKLYKFGLTKKISILDEDNQVFNNLHHIEDGMFVERCTRKNKPSINASNNEPLHSNKIVLESYAEVIGVKETYNIKVLSMPNGYTLKDLKYESEDSSIASINSNTIIGQKAGVTKVKVSSNDDKYTSYINVLVSDNQ